MCKHYMDTYDTMGADFVLLTRKSGSDPGRRFRLISELKAVRTGHHSVCLRHARQVFFP